MIRFMAIIEVKTGTDLENEELNEKIRRKPAVALQLTEMLNEAIEDAQANTAPWSKLFFWGGEIEQEILHSEYKAVRDELQGNHPNRT